MADKSETRRMQLLERLAEADEPQELEALAETLGCDTRTIRRDLDQLQRTLEQAQGLEVRRGRVFVARSRYSPGYFTDQLRRSPEAKAAIARRVVSSLADDLALALTAGSTTYAVAREMRRRVVEGEPPHNLIVFTNSVPSLLELVAAGISTGILGEIYAPEDCAFHAPEFRSAFQPSAAIVGASGVQWGASAPNGLLELFSHRAEEAAFHKQLLASVPEIIVAVDSAKLGRRHPWSFGGPTLEGKTLRLITDLLTPAQRDELEQLAARLTRNGTDFQFAAACNTNENEAEVGP